MRETATGRRSSNPLFQSFNVPDLLAEGIPATKWHGAPGLFVRGFQHAINGSSEAGKTLLKMDLAVHMAAKIMPMGLPAAPESDVLDDDVRLLYVDFENPPRLTLQRFGYIFKDLANNRNEDFDAAAVFEKKLFYRPFPAIGALNTREGADKVLEFIDAKRINFLMVDTLSKVIDGDENSVGAYTDLANYLLKELRANSVTSVWGDHMGHVEKRARGSSGKKDNWDAGWNVEAGKRNVDTGITELTLTSGAKNRSGDLPPELWVTRHGKPLPYIRHVWEGAGTEPNEIDVANAVEPQSVKVKRLLRDNEGHVLTLTHRGKPSVKQIRDWLKDEHGVTLRDSTVNDLIKGTAYVKERLFDDKI